MGKDVTNEDIKIGIPRDHNRNTFFMILLHTNLNNGTTLQLKALLSNDDISDEKKLEIANLARLIGPSSSLNPQHLEGLSASDRIIVENLGINRTAWVLRYGPVDVTSLTFNQAGGSFAVRVSSFVSLLNAG